jgi:hypothetical protein
MIRKAWAMLRNLYSSARQDATKALIAAVEDKLEENRRANLNLEATVRDMLDEGTRLRVTRH